MLIGAINAANGEANKVKNFKTGKFDAVPATARAYKKDNQPWVVVSLVLSGLQDDANMHGPIDRRLELR